MSPRRTRPSPRRASGCMNRPWPRLRCSHFRTRSGRAATAGRRGGAGRRPTAARPAAAAPGRRGPSTTAEVVNPRISRLNSSEPCPSTRWSQARVRTRASARQGGDDQPEGGGDLSAEPRGIIAEPEDVTDRHDDEDRHQIGCAHRQCVTALPARPGRVGFLSEARRAGPSREPGPPGSSRTVGEAGGVLRSTTRARETIPFFPHPCRRRADYCCAGAPDRSATLSCRVAPPRTGCWFGDQRAGVTFGSRLVRRSRRAPMITSTDDQAHAACSVTVLGVLRPSARRLRPHAGGRVRV